MNIKYPNVQVKLVGENGNAFMIIGLVTRALRKARVADDEVKAFQKEAMSSNYDNLLQTAMKWVDVH